MKTIITLLCIMCTSGCAVYSIRKCPDNTANEKACSKLFVMSFRKIQQPSLIIKSSDGAELQFKSQTIQSAVTADDVERAANALKQIIQSR